MTTEQQIQDRIENKEQLPAKPLTTADLASPSAPLFVQGETEQFRATWAEIQTGFVDEPRDAVQKADELVARCIKRLAEVFAEERSKMEHEWDRGDNVSTEDLRQALRRYRSFFDRLLSV